MNTEYNIDVVAYPTNDYGPKPEWHIAIGIRFAAGQRPHIDRGSHMLAQLVASGTTPMNNLGTQGAAEVTLWSSQYWTATSFRIDQDQLPQEPFTVFSDRPVSVGASVASLYEISAGGLLMHIGLNEVMSTWSNGSEEAGAQPSKLASEIAPEARPEFNFENGESYIGQWVGTERHGQGVHRWPNGAKYEGQFERNRASGQGTFQFPNGGVYEGQWKADRAHGHGSYRHFDQASYDGQWRNDKQHGEGVELWPDGARFEGQHREGQKSGKGKLLWPDGSSYSGNFEGNALHGEGVYRWADGKEYSGQWAKDRMSGAGCFTWPDGRVYTGQPSTNYNELPCTCLPQLHGRKTMHGNDPLEGLGQRWVCPLADSAPFKETTYGVRLKVRNPAEPGAARSWRIELWEQDAAKPVSATRGIRGMEVSGPMQAALSQENQLLDSINTVRFDIIPSQPIGNVPNTRLRVLAPPGFFIIKRCLNFMPIELPDAECIGSDSNSFELVFSEPGAIQAGVQYSFSLQMQNPVDYIPDDLNVWSFDTLRPDGVARDTARSPGFFLYPYAFSSFVVVPLMRKPGPQTVVIRFVSPLLIPFDDYIRIRAPEGVAWYSADLQFSTEAALTQANLLGAQDPTVEFETPNELAVQLTTTAEANFEYGMAARAEIPQSTPVPNAWWIEQYRRTGLPAPNSWRYIASKGAAGFKTQVLVNTRARKLSFPAMQLPQVSQRLLQRV
ncbi:PIP5K2 [Symbiodinium necroappetens]|uniref:PIP5K2 protein n=1 Tax=Symbiodinium necroappetens TaxID=1628268 RepID=A0A812TFZ9_9DINO|nr:PIP5K2 [Symbiodinium necroappetens]